MKSISLSSIVAVLGLFLYSTTAYSQQLTIKGNYLHVIVFPIYNLQLGAEYQSAANYGYYLHYVKTEVNAPTHTLKSGVNIPLDKRRFPIFVNIGAVYSTIIDSSIIDHPPYDYINDNDGIFGLNIGCGKKHRLGKNLRFETIMGLYPRLINTIRTTGYQDKTKIIKYQDLKWAISPYLNFNFTYSFQLKRTR